MTGTNNYTNLDYLLLMSDGDEEMVQTMLGMLLDELPEEFNKMVYLHQAQKWEELAKVCHKMKSTLAFVGNEKMTQANRNIELAAKSSKNLENLPGYFEEMSSLLPHVLQALKDAMD